MTAEKEMKTLDLNKILQVGYVEVMYSQTNLSPEAIEHNRKWIKQAILKWHSLEIIRELELLKYKDPSCSISFAVNERIQQRIDKIRGRV